MIYFHIFYSIAPLVQPKISITPAPPKKPLNLQESNIDAKEFNSIKVFVPLDLKRPKSKKKISENVIQREGKYR